MSFRVWAAGALNGLLASVARLIWSPSPWPLPRDAARPNLDATTEWTTKIRALGAGDKTTLLVAALRAAWAAASSPKDITTVYRG